MDEDVTLPEGATLIDLIDHLVEPAPPPPIPMMPQTWGWVVLAIILLVALALAIWRAWRWHHSNAYRREALRQIEANEDDPAKLAAILRRTALAAYPRMDVAGLTGESWLRFLDRQTGGTDFTKGAGRAVARAPYAPQTEAPDLAPIIRRWVTRHPRNEEAA